MHFIRSGPDLGCFQGSDLDPQPLQYKDDIKTTVSRNYVLSG